jgi:hypothetical protein
MRTSKFRGLRTDGKGWAFGDLLHPHQGNPDTFIAVEHGHIQPVKPETVGQFTSVTDWDAEIDLYEPKDIFEGDRCVVGSIQPHEQNAGREGVVKFDEGAFWIDFGDDAIPAWSDGYYLTVIGNIHTT